jgi:riboflavin biosynthesis pyrimidine reductase
VRASTDFERFLAEKQRPAKAARIGTFHTEEDNSSRHVVLSLGNDWVRAHYDGDFLLSPLPEALPGVSLAFVRSREGNTVAPNPADLGGGDTDLHLLYEGLARVAADGVLAGSRTASGRVLFSVWHPELVALRDDLGLPRHPAQIVVSLDGHLDPHRTLLFNIPSVPVFVIAGPKCRERCGRLLDRPGVTVIPTDDANLTNPLLELRRHGMDRISVVGGRITASSLIDAGLVQDIYLTTTLRSAGKPGTPFYAGAKPPELDLIVRKRLMSGRGEPAVRFEHFKMRPAP